MPTKIHELVKTYKLINDPNSPNWSVRFVGAIAGVALLVAAVGAIMWASSSTESHASPNQALASTVDNGDGTRTDYVGFDPAHFDAAIGYDAGYADQQFALWQQTHPGATVVAKDPQWSGSHVIGYHVTYR